MLHRTIQFTMLAAMTMVAPLFATDKLDASFSPPGGLAVDSVPVFIVLGFDDNRYVDGMQFVLDLLKGKKNPAGTKNPATFDGQDIGSTFYYTSSALENDTFGGEKLLKLWKEAATRGYEVGCHTVTHETSKTTTLAQWKKEIGDCNKELASALGIDATTIQGFRTPYLDFNAETFTAIASQGMAYECTMTLMQEYNKGMFYWPFTLDQGFPIGVIDGWAGKVKIPGLWEIPVYTMNSDPLMWPPITGFDSSILTQANGKDFEAMMKQALDYRLKSGGNRAPLTVGLHSDTYSKDNPTGKNYDGALSLDARRAALTHFVEYALKMPQVRFVTGKQLIEWMKKPIPLGRAADTGIHEKAVCKSLITAVQVGDKIRTTVPSAGTYTVELYSISGRKIWNSAMNISSLESTFSLPTVFHGLGIMKITGANHTIQTKVVR